MAGLGMVMNIGICDVTCGVLVFICLLEPQISLQFLQNPWVCSMDFQSLRTNRWFKPMKAFIQVFKMSKYSHISSNHRYRAMNLIHFSGESDSSSEQDGFYNIKNEEIGQVDW